MSDSPIFDELNAAQDYTGTMAVVKRSTSRFRTIGMAQQLPLSTFLQEVHDIADRTLGVEEEPEVLAQPFVAVQGEPRGLITGPEIIEEFFDPIELEEKGISFTEFSTKMIEKFKEKYPHAEHFRISATQTDFAGPREKFVVESYTPHVSPETPSKTEDAPQEALGAILADWKATVALQHPGFIPMAVTAIQEHEDGSATLEVEGQYIPPVKPLSEKNTAQVTE